MPLLNKPAARWIVMLATVALGGCTKAPPFFPNSDAALRRSSTQFAADAAHRHYEANAPHGQGESARAEIDYGIDRIYFANTSNKDWKNIEIWLNKSYVVFLPEVPANGARSIDISFMSFYDNKGQHFPAYISHTPIDSIEMYRDGKMYAVSTGLAD